MTITWQVTSSGHDRLVSGEEALRAANALGLHFSGVPRVLMRENEGIAFYELLSWGGSCSAVYGARKGHRREIESLYKGFATALLNGGGEVGLICRPESEALPSQVRYSACGVVEECLTSFVRGSPGWWRLDLGPVVFEFRDVLAESFAARPPQRVTIVVTADSVKGAKQALTEQLADRGLWCRSPGTPIVIASDLCPQG